MHATRLKVAILALLLVPITCTTADASKPGEKLTCPGEVYGAINNNSLEQLAAALAKVSVNCRGARNEISPLMWASHRGEAAIMSWLIEKGARIGEATRYGTTALMFAARAGKVAAIKLLRQRGARLDRRDKKGHSALHLAIDQKRLAAVKLLLALGAKNDQPQKVSRLLVGFEMMDAVKADDSLRLAELLHRGGDIRWRNRTGDYLTHTAATLGRLQALRLLLDRGASTEVRGGTLGYTPLISAANKNQLAAATLLLDRGAKVDALYDTQAPLKDRGTALMVAASRGFLKMVHLLLGRGADPNIRGYAGNTALYYAAREGHYEVVVALLRKKANPRLRGYGKKTPEQMARKGGHKRIVAAIRSGRYGRKADAP